MDTSLMQTANRQRRAYGSIFGALLLLINASPVFADSTPSPCDFDSGTQAGLCASTVPGGIGVSGWLHENEQSPAQESTNDPLAVDDERSLQTADAKANPVSGSYKIVVRNCSLGRRPTVRLFLMTPLSFGASCLLILRVDPIRTRGVYPPRATSSTWPPP